MKSRIVEWSAHALWRSGLLVTLERFADRYRLRRDGAGRSRFPYVARRRERSLQILIYHRVNDERDPHFPATPIAAFRSQMEYLARSHAVLPLAEAVRLMERRGLPAGAAAITFDDGYRDNFDHAFPILRGLGLPATLFLATGSIGTGRLLWHDRVFTAFRETAEPRLPALLPGTTDRPLDGVEARLAAQRETLAVLRTLPEEERDRAIDRLIGALRVTLRANASALMLDWEQVRAMHAGGIEIGSHTETHPILSRASDRRVGDEAAGSKRTIERELGTPVAGFAYPNGSAADFDARTKAILRETGYSYAVTTMPGANEPGADPFELRRATPWDEDVCTFALRMNYYKLQS